MAQYSFGTGQLFTAPVGGGAPLQIGTLQDVSVNFSSDLKELYGQYQFPVDVARGKTKVEGKAGTGQLDVDVFNNTFFGQTVTTGQKKQIFNEAGTVPAMSTYTITVANGGTFFMDLGVTYALTGAKLKQVASGPTIGQYTVNSTTGVYTFAAADASAAVLITYLYTSASDGKTLTFTNLLMGNTPKFQLVLSELYNGKTMTMLLYSCVSNKLNFPLKQDNYTIPEIDFAAQANDAGNIGFITISG